MVLNLIYLLIKRNVFLIKKDDELLEDPPLYYLNDIYLNHSLSFC